MFLPVAPAGSGRQPDKSCQALQEFYSGRRGLWGERGCLCQSAASLVSLPSSQVLPLRRLPLNIAEYFASLWGSFLCSFKLQKAIRAQRIAKTAAVWACVEDGDLHKPSISLSSRKKSKAKLCMTACIKSLWAPFHKDSSHLRAASPHRCVMFSFRQQFCPPSVTFWSGI